MDFVAAKDNEEAGLVVERDKDYLFKFTMMKQNGKTGMALVSCAGNDNKILAWKEINPSLGKNIWLKISAEGVFYSFSYSLDGKTWTSLMDKADGHFLGIDAAGRFTGTMLGMYVSSNGLVSENTANFDWFEYLGK